MSVEDWQDGYDAGYEKCRDERDAALANAERKMGRLRIADDLLAKAERRADAALAVVEVAREWDAHWQPSQASSLGRMLDWKLHEALATHDQKRGDG